MLSYSAELGQWKMTISNMFFLRPIHINARTEKPEHSRKKKGKRNEGGRERGGSCLPGPGTVTQTASHERCGLKGIHELLEVTGRQEVSGGIPKLRSLCCQGQCPEHHTTTLVCPFSYIRIKSPSPPTFFGLSSILPPTQQSYTP